MCMFVCLVLPTRCSAAAALQANYQFKSIQHTVRAADCFLSMLADVCLGDALKIVLPVYFKNVVLSTKMVMELKIRPRSPNLGNSKFR